MKYDPAFAPESAEWLALSEGQRIDAVRDLHALAKEPSGNPQLHAVVHVSVETQLAEGHPAARQAMDRLLGEGLDRHDAVHAIGSVVAGQIYQLATTGRAMDPAAYAERLAALKAAEWRAGGGR